MVAFPQRSRLSGIQVAVFRLDLLGGMGDYAKYAIVDAESRPMTYFVSQTFSERTRKCIEALRQSLEQDAHDILREVPEGDEEDIAEESGVTFP